MLRWFRRKRMQEAEKLFDEAGALSVEGCFQEAIERISQAIALVPDFAEAVYNRATDYSMLEDYEHAIADAKRYNELRPTASEAAELLGDVYWESARGSKESLLKARELAVEAFRAIWAIRLESCEQGSIHLS